MRFDEFIARFPVVRQHGLRVMVNCCAHADNTPSLSIREAEDGRILIYCYAGCSPQAIMSSLGLTLNDLFPDAQHIHSRPRPPRPRVDRNRIAFQLRFHGDKLFLRAQAVLEAATKIDITPWTTDQLDLALSAVAKARADLQRADLLDQVAFAIRSRAIENGKTNAA